MDYRELTLAEADRIAEIEAECLGRRAQEIDQKLFAEDLNDIQLEYAL